MFFSPIYLLEIGLQIACVVHAVRRGNVFPWVYIIVFLPLVGCLVYFAMEIVPDMLRSRGVAKARSAATSVLDPNRDYRAAVREAEIVGSVDAKRALAEQYIQRGQLKEGITIYESLLHGQFKDDPVLLLALARAQYQIGDGPAAQATLDALQASEPTFQSGEAHLIYARALELQGKNDEALAEYRGLVRYASGEEARARYAMLLEKMGEREAAREIYTQIVKNLENAQRHYRAAQKEWGNVAKAGLKR